MSDDFPNRQTFRLKNYDYSRNGMYFITICTNNHENMFGEITNGKMVLNEIGKIVEAEILNTTVIRQNIKIDQYTIMPNHVHLIIQIQNTTPPQTHIRRGGVFPPENLKIPDNLQTNKIIEFDEKKEILLSNIIKSGGVVESGGKTPPLRLGQIVALMKYLITTKYNEIMNIKNRKYFKLWQRNYHEHIIRDENSYHKIVDYIQNNPSKWQNDKFFRDP